MHLIASLLATLAPAAGGVTVTLPMERHVRGVEVVLGEIATVTGTDADEVARVEAVALGSAPAPGYSRVFRTERILDALRRRVPDVAVRFAGQHACRVFPAVEEVTGAEVMRLARERLDAEFAAHDVDFTLVEEVRAVEVPAGAEGVDVRVRTGALPSTGATLSVPVDVLVDGQRYRTIWTSWQVRRWETRSVLARPVRAGETLEASLFERRRVPAREGTAQALSATLLEGAVLLRDLDAGAVVDALDVRRPVAVALGETLFLQVRRGAIEARVPAVALASGAIGDRIRVRMESGQELVATVKSRDLARIDLGTK